MLLLRQHYANTEKPRIITLYEELTTIDMTETEDVTDYLIRAEKAATGLRSAEETISDNLIIAMLLKGLPAAFNSFVVVHTQTDQKKSLTEFKAALRNRVNTEAARNTTTQSTAMAASTKPRQYHYTLKAKLPMHNNKQVCLACVKPGHRARECRSKSKLAVNTVKGLVTLNLYVSKRKRKPTTTNTRQPVHRHQHLVLQSSVTLKHMQKYN